MMFWLLLLAINLVIISPLSYVCYRYTHSRWRGFLASYTIIIALLLFWNWIALKNHFLYGIYYLPFVVMGLVISLPFNLMVMWRIYSSCSQ